MARQSSADKELADMTECSICMDEFTDPRVLPCLHTFCLKCLLNCGKDKRPGGRMNCPLCRTKFTVPRGGLSEMQKDFRVDKMIHIRKLLTEQEEENVPRTDSIRSLSSLMAKGNGVGGVTSLGDAVFVVRFISQQKIEVYDGKTFVLQRHITVPGLGDFPFGLVACPNNNCLYASDSDNDRIHRVELTVCNAVMKWCVARYPIGLSVNGENNMIVVSKVERKLQIFTTHGTLLQDIQLPADIGDPWHAVQLPKTSQFLVSHTGSLHRVCLVGVDGAVVRGYGGQAGSELTQLNAPRGLAVDRKGRVLVSDMDNKRLLVIDKSLSIVHEMYVTVDDGLKGPTSLWYDQSRRRLYIGEGFGGRVIVIDNLEDFRTEHS